MTAESVVLIGLPGAATDEVVGRLSALLAAGSVERYDTVEVAPLEALAEPQARINLHRGAVVWLDGTDATLADHVEGTGTAELAALRRQALRDLTTAADLIVDVDGRTPDLIVKAVVDGLADPRTRNRERLVTETVAFDDGRSYPIHIGRGAVRRLADVVPKRAERVAVITQPGIGVEVVSGRDQRTFLLEPGEESKRLATVGELASALARWGMTRADAVVSVGGGVVSDVAGFLAASY
ncbi:MAG: hypothetical protein OEW83_18300, partial [Acidimicrobiia bacterium]|nr:hypothetical protein [Acidimicrobiia bacterium]